MTHEQHRSLFAMSPEEHRFIRIVCPNCDNTKPQPVFRVTWQGRTLWVCAHCKKHFPRE
jgi:transposase-like protein